MWIVLGPVILAIAWAARQTLAAVADSHKPAPVDATPLSVRTTRLAPETLKRAVRYSGIVKEWRRVDLSFRVGGVVDELQRFPHPNGGYREVQEGDQFVKGAILARIDPRDYMLERALAAQRLAQAEAKLASSQADADNARTEYDRDRRLDQSSAVSKSDLATARSKFLSTEATAKASAREVEGNRVQLSQADANVSYCSLAMPYEKGTIATRYIEANERVNAGQKAFQIIDLSSVRISFGVSDSVVGQLAIGKKVDVTTDALPEDRFEGVIIKIAPTADAQARTYLVEVQVREPRGLRPGMVATASIGEEKTALLLPLIAVTREAETGRLVAYKRAKEGERATARAVPVELEGVLDNRVAVRPTTPGGLRIGDEVLVGGVSRMFDGAPIKVIGSLTQVSKEGR
jgi:RND family efflux transporter MFP subunit